MKRLIRCSFTFDDILNDQEGRELIERIEEAEDELRGRGIDFNDYSEFWARARQQDIEELRDKFGYDWD